MLELLPFATALAAGFLHALEPDHMAAVTTFVSRQPHPLRALAFGIRWGAGHSLAILAIGGVLILLDVHVPETLARGLEFGVGMMLLGLALWLLWSLLHARAHERAHEMQHPSGTAHRHRHATTWVGVVHGLAGTAPLIAVLPLALTRSAAGAALYLLLFGVGTVLAMGLYAAIAGAAFHRIGRAAPRAARYMTAATAVGSAVIGAVWMHGALG